MFLNELYEVNDDEFISGNWPAQKDNDSLNTAFHKKDQPGVMVLKEVRYHYLIENFINAVPNMKIIGLIRNPCAVIYSWLENPMEFRSEWNILTEWRHAPGKNQGRPEEYFGYEKWKELATFFLDLERKYPENFLLVQYEHLVSKPIETISQVFSFAKLEIEKPVFDFIKASQSYHMDDVYALYKFPSVKDQWRSGLDPRISGEIIKDIKDTVLERFFA